eukprot:18278-Heterococcus_DN1.PRE.3
MPLQLLLLLHWHYCHYSCCSSSSAYGTTVLRRHCCSSSSSTDACAAQGVLCSVKVCVRQFTVAVTRTHASSVQVNAYHKERLPLSSRVCVAHFCMLY